MDERQQKQVNEAAEKFADALKESYQSIADRSVSAQELLERAEEQYDAYMDLFYAPLSYYKEGLRVTR